MFLKVPQNPLHSFLIALVRLSGIKLLAHLNALMWHPLSINHALVEMVHVHLRSRKYVSLGEGMILIDLFLRKHGCIVSSRLGVIKLR